MSVQNNYNNYIKRQTQKSSNNNFKEKVANSLAGKTVNNTTTTITTPVGYGVIGTNTGVATTPSTSVSNTSVTQNNTVTPVTTSSVATNPSTLSRSIGARSTSSTSTSTKTSAIDKANELYQQQQDQLKKEWETQKAELEQQQKYYEDTYNQSKLEAENDYKTSEETLQDNRYKQMQDLAVSGQRRGIQYSPQQLALENNANINYNKNLTQLSEKRNELLNKLQIELNNNLAQIALGLQGAVNNYNGNMINLAESHMDRINSLNAGGTGSSKYSYGSSYTPYSYKSNYTPYTSNSKSRSYDNELELANALLSGDEDYENAYLKTFADNSSSISDELNVGTLNDVETKAEIYKEQVDGEIAYAKSVGASQRVIDEMEAVRDETLMNLYNQSYARSTNTPYQIGDTVYKPSTPVRKEYIDKTKAENGKRKYDYVKKNLMEKVSHKNSDGKTVTISVPKKGNTETWFKAVNDRNALDLHNKIMNSSKNKTTKTNTSEETTKPKTSIKVQVAKATTNKNVEKSVDNAKKNVSNAKTNAKKNVEKAKTNVKKNVANAKSNVKKNVSNSIKNAKKNTVKSTLSKFKTNISKSLKKLFK